MDVRDRLQRPLRDLRISVTDRCNFRCTYCMPAEIFGPGFAFLEREELLTFEEIRRIVGVFAGLGVRKLRLTGGEPLLRRGIADLVGLLAAVEGIEDIALTTNGSLLPRHAEALRAAGLRRITVSLDSVDERVFSSMADVSIPLAKVLDGIQAARDAGFGPIKLNAVVKRGVNDAGILPLVEYAREHGDVVRFIEFMDVGTTNGWRTDDVVPAAEVVERIAAVHPLAPLEPATPGEVARRWAFADGGGEVGVITSVTQPFCGTCTRGRLSAIGELYTCLFGTGGVDLRALLRGGATDEDLHALVTGTWEARSDRYSELRSAGTADLPRVEMSYIGG
jgi:GTP 3',8-cyclase